MGGIEPELREADCVAEGQRSVTTVTCAEEAQKSEGTIGYWFACEPVLPNRDGRAVVIGEALTVNPPLYLCLRGLHGSEHPFDALQYATGPLLYRCRFSGEIIHGTDKLCASERTALAVLDFTPQLGLFARQQALSVIHLWNAPAMVRKFLETGEESLRDAAGAAAGAARDAGGTTLALAVAATTARAAARAAITRAAITADWAARAAARAATEAAEAAWPAGAAHWAATVPARATFMRIVEDAFARHDRLWRCVQ